MRLTLSRSFQTEDFTLGKLFAPSDELICNTLERGWLNNQRQISCIPNGLYALKLYQSQRYPNALKVWDISGDKEVTGRTAILIHVGNYINYSQAGHILNDSAGCILPVDSIKDAQKSGVFGTGSRKAMDRLLVLVKSFDNVELLIRTDLTNSEDNRESVSSENALKDLQLIKNEMSNLQSRINDFCGRYK